MGNVARDFIYVLALLWLTLTEIIYNVRHFIELKWYINDEQF